MEEKTLKIFWCSMKQCWCKYADKEDSKWCKDCLSGEDIEIGENNN